MAPQRCAGVRVAAWDRVVRLLHWMLAALVAVDLVRDDGDYAHRLVGYAAAAVVLVRLSWAAVSRSHAGLASLRPSVVAVAGLSAPPGTRRAAAFGRP